MAWIGYERFWEAQGETPNPRRASEDGEESQQSTCDIRAAGISEQVGLKAPVLGSSPDPASVFEWDTIQPITVLASLGMIRNNIVG